MQNKISSFHTKFINIKHKENLKREKKKKDSMGVIKYSNLLVTTFLMSLLSFTIESRSHIDVIFPLEKYGNIVSGADVTEV